MDDILVRSKREKTHLVDLEETFDNIRWDGLRIKAKKYAFGINVGHFLDFQITPQRESNKGRKRQKQLQL